MTPRFACGWILLMQGLVAVTPLLAADDDWIGAPAAPDVWLQIWGGGSENSESAGIDAVVAMGATRLYARAERNRTVDADLTLLDERWGIGLGSAPSAAMTARVDVLSHGEKEAAEFMEYWLELSGFAGAWDMSLRAMNGNAELFLRKDRPLPRVRRRSAELETHALGASVGYLVGSMRFDVASARYWYSEDLGAITDRPLLEFALGPVTVGHSASLPDNEDSCGVSLVHSAWDFALRYHRSRSALDGERLDSAHLSVGRRVDNNFGIGGRTVVPLDGSSGYGELMFDVAF